jgi:predicted transposase YdaD
MTASSGRGKSCGGCGRAACLPSFLYLKQYQPPHPWQAVVIYPSRAVDPGDHPHYATLLHSAQVHRIYLEAWVKSPQTFSQRLIHLLLADPQQALAEAHDLLQPVDMGPKALILDLIETILVYKLPALSRKEIQTMLGLTDRDLKQTRFYQEVFAEGKQEGRQEGEVALVLRLLERRCGVLAPELKERIAGLSLVQMEALAEALLEFTGPADLEQWVRAHVET